MNKLRPQVPTVQFSRHSSVSEISKKKWDQLVEPYNLPFYHWEWLHNLEISKSIGKQAGFLPMHFSVWQGDTLAGIAPLFLKYHSSGEFIFDRPFIEAAQTLGYLYYPKLLGMSPYTPANGYQFFFRKGCEYLNGELLREVQKFCKEQGIFTVQFLYVDPQWKNSVLQNNFLEWNHASYIWENPGFSSFEDYLSFLTAKRRKNIRKEQEYLAQKNIKYQYLKNNQISAEKLEEMYRLYVNTCNKFLWWGSQYLTRAFFLNLEILDRKNLLLIEATDKKNGEILGMSFFLKKGKNLYGRYWGAEESIKFLHFELCYYRPIRWCIENNFLTFDAGSGNGPHKKRRGFPAKMNSSLLFFHEKEFQKLAEDYLLFFNKQQQEAIAEFNKK